MKLAIFIFELNGHVQRDWKESDRTEPDNVEKNRTGFSLRMILGKNGQSFDSPGFSFLREKRHKGLISTETSIQSVVSCSDFERKRIQSKSNSFDRKLVSLRKIQELFS